MICLVSLDIEYKICNGPFGLSLFPKVDSIMNMSSITHLYTRKTVLNYEYVQTDTRQNRPGYPKLLNIFVFISILTNRIKETCEEINQ